MERPAFSPKELARPPAFDLAGGAQNAPDDRASYRAVEVVRTATFCMMLTCRWQESLPHGAGYMLQEKLIPYFQLGDIDVMGDEHLSLISTYSLVHLEGRNLRCIPVDFRRGRVEALQEFDPKRWDMPLPDQPLIERMWVEGRGPARCYEEGAMSFKLPIPPKTDLVGGFTEAVADIRAKLVDEAWFGRTDAVGARQVDIWSTIKKDDVAMPEGEPEPEAEAAETSPDLEPEL